MRRFPKGTRVQGVDPPRIRRDQRSIFGKAAILCRLRADMRRAKVNAI
jgi:hypothetical protein